MKRRSPVRIVSIMWGSYVPVFLEAARESSHVELAIFSQKEIENDPDCLEDFWAAAARADILFFYRTADGFWQEVDARLDEVGPDKVVVTTSFDPADWGRNATVDLAICAKAYTYLAEGGKENYRRLLDLLAHQVDPQISVQDPAPMPWQGILHPPDQNVYESVEEYRKAHPALHSQTV
ncbi:MAG: hypothetical protein B1H11_07065, partial [Desulfobacteraceae bacterium 4484_190.1]